MAESASVEVDASISGYRRLVLGLVALACLLFALLGGVSNVVALMMTPKPHATPSYRTAIHVVVPLSTLAYAGLAVVGVQLLRFRTGALRLFVIVLASEFLYSTALLAVSVPRLLRGDDWWAGVALACGAANFSMHVQVGTFFVVWGPLLVAWVVRPGKVTEGHP